MSSQVGQYDFVVPNGQYTLSFNLQNWITLPDPNVLQAELTSLGFLQNITVTNGGIIQYMYNVTFTFVGHASEYMIDDAQSEIVSQWGIGGNEFTYAGSAMTGSQTATQTITSQAATTAQQVGSVAATAATAAGQAVAAGTEAATGTSLGNIGWMALAGLAIFAVILIVK